MASIFDIGIPNEPLGTPGIVLTEWQAAVAAVLGSDVPIDQRPGGGTPTGTIVMFGGNLAPAGWHLCNGTPHNSAALQAVIGSPNAPDLRDRFIVGAGTAYAVGATGGANSVTLLAAQSGMPDHAHTVPGQTVGTGYKNQNATHAHGASAAAANVGGYKSDYIRMGDDISGSAYGYLSQTTKNMTYGNHGHAVTVNAADTNHTHNVTVPAVGTYGSGAANASLSHENRPPYYALTYIIRL